MRQLSTSNRPLVQLDMKFEEELKQVDSEIKARRHPGIMTRYVQ